jgi:tellurite resistance protein
MESDKGTVSTNATRPSIILGPHVQFPIRNCLHQTTHNYAATSVVKSKTKEVMKTHQNSHMANTAMMTTTFPVLDEHVDHDEKKKMERHIYVSYSIEGFDTHETNYTNSNTTDI